MHLSADELMQDFARKVPADALVLDVGAYDVNGNIRDLFGVGYRGCDQAAGPNVDIVQPSPYVIPLADASMDVVVSVSCFEHVRYPWRLVLEIDRVLKPGGLVAIVAPLVWDYHAFPDDYWRFCSTGLVLLFTEWLVDNGRQPYIVHEHFDQPALGTAPHFMDAYLEAQKP